MKDQPPSSSGTLRRGQLSRQPTGDSHTTSGSGGISHHPLQPPNPTIIKQSSTESAYSNPHSSSDATAMAPHNNRFRQQGREQPPGGQSWHGTPRADSNRRGGTSGRHVSSGVGDTQNTTLPRRTPAGGDIHHRLQQDAGGSNSLDGTLKKRRSAGVGAVNYGEGNYQNNTAVPLIEFHLVNGSPNNSPGMRGENFNTTAVPSNKMEIQLKKLIHCLVLNVNLQQDLSMTLTQKATL